MRQPALDGAAGRDHGLSDHLPAEHPLPARLRAVAAEQIHLELFEVEDCDEIDQAFGHGLNFLAVSPGSMLRNDTLGRSALVSPHCFAHLKSASKTRI
ncbi:hypothetical protein ACVWXO_002431 [Bradyrhizobium sp. LM2.7]